jgi:hypothetical protein
MSEERTLADRAAAPDPTRWVDDHGDCLYRYALARVGRPEAAEDLVQETLLAALEACGLGRVVVETANKLQGLEFEVVFVWHPLAGLPEADGFHLDPGRLCVLLTRHRQACIVVGRAGDPGLLEDQVPPPTAAYLGCDADPVLDDWEVHRQVFQQLAHLKVTL